MAFLLGGKCNHQDRLGLGLWRRLMDIQDHFVLGTTLPRIEEMALSVSKA